MVEVSPASVINIFHNYERSEFLKFPRGNISCNTALVDDLN